MKKIVIFIFCIIIYIGVYSQINVISKFPQNRDIVSVPYDSTTNYLRENYYQYIGQTLYFPKSTLKSNYGIEDFNIKPKTGTTYKKKSSNCTKSEFILGKYFLVTDTAKNKYGTIFLKLKELESGDIIYYHYRPNMQHDSSFPFFVKGYFEKQREINIGKIFPIFHHSIMIYSDKYIKPKQALEEYSTYGEWTCIDYYIDEGVSPREIVVLKDTSSQVVTMSYSSLLKETENVLVIDADIQRKINKEKGFKNLRIGMSKLDVVSQCGSPIEENITTTESTTYQQWVYEFYNLYFENDILTVIQDK